MFVSSVLRLEFLVVFTLLLTSYIAHCSYNTLNGEPPLVIGHRGASGLRPAHTLASYELAIDLGADYVEPDLLMTKDGVLICRHEPMLSLSTNVASFPEFADRKKWKKVSGLDQFDWFVSDFTLEEIKKLRAIQANFLRSPEYNGKFEIATFDEVIELVKAKSTELGKTIGIYPELKHPIFHQQHKLPLIDKLLEVLDREGWNHKDSAVFVQSSEVAALQYVRTKSTVKLMQLYLGAWVNRRGKVNSHGAASQPYDFEVNYDRRSFVDLTRDKGLDFVKSYADAIGVWTPYVIPYTYRDRNHDGIPDDLNGDNHIDNRDFIALKPTNLIERAHNKGLLVHVWTLKNEESSLLSNYDGDPVKEAEALYKLGVDGIFSDFPGTAYIARENCFSSEITN